MRYEQVLSLRAGHRVVATADGNSNGQSYQTGTIAIVKRDEEGTIELVTARDFRQLGSVVLAKWERLRRCRGCKVELREYQLNPCPQKYCERVRLCPRCVVTHQETCTAKRQETASVITKSCPYDEGFYACRNGEGFEANPYTKLKDRNEWTLGYTDARA